MKPFVRPGQHQNPRVRINHYIRSPMLRVIGAAGEQLGILTNEDALSRAREANLDLVEVAAMADPPVVKIMDYGKFRYQQEKKVKESKKKTHAITIKEIKLRPKIGQNDLDVKTKQIQEFFADGNKVKVTMQFKGRELAYTGIGKKVLDSLVLALKDVATPDTEATLEGKSMSLMFTPRKPSSSKPSETKIETKSEVQNAQNED